MKGLAAGAAWVCTCDCWGRVGDAARGAGRGAARGRGGLGGEQDCKLAGGACVEAASRLTAARPGTGHCDCRLFWWIWGGEM